MGRNKIIEADLDEEDFDPTEFAEEEEGGEYDAGTDDDLTEEDVQEELRNMGEREVAAVSKSRQRGRAPDAAAARSRATPAQKAAKTRAPVRARVEEWKPADTLDAPPPMPGMEGRWVRFRIGNEDDHKNVSKMMRQGWKPRELSTVPKGYFPPTFKHAQLGEIIAVADLMYCERPRSMGIAQKKYVRAKLARMVDAGRRHVRNAERDDHPIEVTDRHQVRTGVYGKKRRATVQDDE